MVGAYRQRWVVLGLLGAMLVLLAGCGGNGGESPTTKDVVLQPKPNEPISTRVDQFNDAIATQDCRKLAPLASSLTRPTTTPGAPPSSAECRATKPLLKSLKGMEMKESAEFGTGALSQGTPRKRSDAPRSVGLWVVDRDGSYRVLSVADAAAQLDTKIPDPDAAEETVGEFIRAVKEHDCRTLERLVDPDGRLAAGSPRKQCEAIADGRLFAPALEATPEPAPEFFGGTRAFAFAGVPTANGYFTIVLGSEKRGRMLAPTIQDVHPSTQLKLPSRDKDG